MHIRFATLPDLLTHLCERKSPLTASDYGLYVAEAQAGRMLVLDIDGRPAALGGVFRPDTGGPATCWFSVTPGSLARSLAAVAVLMRNHLRRIGPLFAEGLAAYVSDGNAEGARLATALGFQPSAVTVGTLRGWLYVGRAHRQNSEAAVATRRGGAGRAARGDRQAAGGP